ncbi:MAG: hypothetical protein ACFB00_05860 [Parvularculaceae bacterium]
MRFAGIVLLLIVAALVGLYVFGLSLEPEVRTIEQEAVRATPND